MKYNETSYFLNWMGPISKEWCDEHGSHWCVGRIDVSGAPNEPYGIEYFVPTMHKEDWARFSTFLNNLKSDKGILYTRDELYHMFEKLNGKIRWKNNDKT